MLSAIRIRAGFVLGISDLDGSDLDVDAFVDGDWIRAGIIIVVAIAVSIAIARTVRSILERTLGSGFAAILVARILAYIVFLVGLVYALNTLGVRVGPLLGALGLGGVVLALALQKVVENFVGGVILQTRRPFTIGDTVEIDDHVGVVIDIDSRTTVLRGLDGASIRIPNGSVLNTAIINLTREGARRSELSVGVAYDSNLERATEVLIEATRRVSRVRGEPPPLVVLRAFGESTIDFTIFFWHASDVPSELTATHDLMLAVHHGLAAAGITIAFPQMVVWPGHDADDDPYGREPGRVYTAQPVGNIPIVERDGAAEEETPRRWRLPWRRNST